MVLNYRCIGGTNVNEDVRKLDIGKLTLILFKGFTSFFSFSAHCNTHFNNLFSFSFGIGTHIVVGTPGDYSSNTKLFVLALIKPIFRLYQHKIGRVYDMISRKVLRTKAIKLFVLDEADEMLSRGFKDQIYDVFKLLPSDVQVILLSGRFQNIPIICLSVALLSSIRISKQYHNK